MIVYNIISVSVTLADMPYLAFVARPYHGVKAASYRTS